MSAGLLAGLLAGVLVFTALTGPSLLRGAAPAFVKTPRLAVMLLVGTVVGWVGGLLALGPLLAWVASGPVLLPGQAAQVCQRCLAAANPFGVAPAGVALPAIVLLGVPAAAVGLLTAVLLLSAARRRRVTAWVVSALRRTHLRSALVSGERVLVLDDQRPYAMTLPRAHGGVIFSRGALEVLDGPEAAAVLAHEHAHLRQHHHLLVSVVTTLVRYFARVPLMAAAQEALEHYLEIAADARAIRQVGARPLASALLQLSRPTGSAGPLVGVLHATGPDRVRALVQPGDGGRAAVPAFAAGLHLAVLIVLAAGVLVPYLGAALAGCA